MTAPAVGTVLDGPVRAVTPQRVEWYDSAMLSAASGQLAQVGSNIHTDSDYARAEGFPDVMADGMIMTNWCQTMLVGHFGIDYLERGTLRTKFIRPVYLDIPVKVRAKVLESTPTKGGTRLKLEVWCEDPSGARLVDGDSTIEVRAG
jgi:acyl dehydratase